jgi:hypothetical protein
VRTASRASTLSALVGASSGVMGLPAWLQKGKKGVRVSIK